MNVTAAPERAKRHSLGLLLIGTLLSGMPLFIYLSILPPYALSLGASLSLVGVISGSYGVFQFLLRLPLGLIADRWQRPKLIVNAGIVCAVVACLGLFLATDPRSFVLWRVLGGLAAATQGVLAALFAAQFNATRKPRAMGLFIFMVNLAVAVGPLVGGLLAESLGWRAPFVVGAVLGVLGLAIMSYVTEPRRTSTVLPAMWHRLAALSAAQGTARTRAIVRTLWHRLSSQNTTRMPDHISATLAALWSRLAALLLRPRVGQAAALMMVSGFAQYVTTHTFIPIRAVELGAGRAHLGWLTFLTMGMASLGALLSGNVIAVRLTGRWTVGLGFVLVASSTAVVPWISTLPLLAITQLATGFGLGLGVPMFVTWSLEAVAPADQGSAASLCLTGGSLGVFVGPIIGGFVADSFGLNAVFLMVGALCLVAAAWPIAQALKLRTHMLGTSQ